MVPRRSPPEVERGASKCDDPAGNPVSRRCHAHDVVSHPDRNESPYRDTFSEFGTMPSVRSLVRCAATAALFTLAAGGVALAPSAALAQHHGGGGGHGGGGWHGGGGGVGTAVVAAGTAVVAAGMAAAGVGTAAFGAAAGTAVSTSGFRRTMFRLRCITHRTITQATTHRPTQRTATLGEADRRDWRSSGTFRGRRSWISGVRVAGPMCRHALVAVASRSAPPAPVGAS